MEVIGMGMCLYVTSYNGQKASPVFSTGGLSMGLAASLHDKFGAKKIVIMDGGTGTEISRRGVVIHPELSCTKTDRADVR